MRRTNTRDGYAGVIGEWLVPVRLALDLNFAAKDRRQTRLYLRINECRSKLSVESDQIVPPSAHIIGISSVSRGNMLNFHSVRGGVGVGGGPTGGTGLLNSENLALRLHAMIQITCVGPVWKVAVQHPR